MNIEYELFKKSTFKYPNLIKYGFIKELNGYKYEKNILNSNFKIIINVKDNKLKFIIFGFRLYFPAS